MEMLQMQSVEVKELERLQSLLSNKLFRLSEALAQKTEVDQISMLIDEVSESADLYLSLQRECTAKQDSNAKRFPVVYGERCAAHLVGMKHYFHVENFNRLTHKTIAFYSEILSERLSHVEKSLDHMNK